MATMVQKGMTLAQSALRDFSNNNCSYMAAGIAYWTLFSLFPLALAGISILGFFYPTPQKQGEIIELIIQLIPVSGGYLADLINSLARARGALGLLAIIGFLFSGAKVFAAIRRGINHVWDTDTPHSFMLARAIDFFMLLAVALIAVVLIFGSTVLGFLSPAGPAAGVSGVLLQIFHELLIWGFTFVVFLLLYRYIPSTKVTWRDTWLGALVGTLLFQVVRIGFTWFVTHVEAFNIVYGSLGALFAVLSWAYFSSLALMWGAQVSATYSRLYGFGESAVRPEILQQ